MKDFFKEIIGYEDVKRELRIIVEMLNNPDIYEKMGASKEKGLLLFSKPGTGKTTMAECIVKATKRKCFTCRKKSSDGSFIDSIVKTFEEANSILSYL